MGPINTGDTAWVLISTALVMLMTPGLALFYGGLVRRKNVLSTIMHSFFILGLVSVTWVPRSRVRPTVHTLAMERSTSAMRRCCASASRSRRSPCCSAGGAAAP